MRLTLRGRRVIIGAVAVLSLTAGATAQLWNPYTRGLDRCQTERFEDGSALITCAEHRFAVHNDPVTDR